MQGGRYGPGAPEGSWHVKYDLLRHLSKVTALPPSWGLAASNSILRDTRHKGRGPAVQSCTEAPRVPAGHSRQHVGLGVPPPPPDWKSTALQLPREHRTRERGRAGRQLLYTQRRRSGRGMIAEGGLRRDGSVWASHPHPPRPRAGAPARLFSNAQADVQSFTPLASQDYRHHARRTGHHYTL